MPIVAAAAIVAAATVGTSVYASKQEKKSQKSALEAQEAAVRSAEEKAKAAEKLSQEEASASLKKLRLAQTQTILTSPLGIAESPQIAKTTLGAG